MSRRIYVAGASKEPERVRRWMDAITRAGWSLTLDWLALIEAEATPDAGLSREDRERYAAADWRAVRDADVVWLLAPENASTGAWVELGLALGEGRSRVVVSGPGAARSIFAALTEEHASDEAAFRAITGGPAS